MEVLLMKRIFALLLAAVSLISLTACAQPEAKTASKYQLAAPQYPQMAQYPDETKFSRPNGDFDSDGFNQVYNAWQADRRKQTDQPAGYTDALDAYLRAVIPQLLTGGSGENKVCSPINIYMALAMLAEVTDSESREQILAMLGSGDVDALRAEAAAVWNANYCDDGAVTSILANSLWLSDKISFKQEAMDALARYYYASSFRGEMGSAAFDKALQDWIDQQTGGLLKEQASGLTMDKETILALASTIYFRAKWNGEFSEANTAPDTFHADSGDVTCDFMRQRGTNTYYWSDRFSAVSKPLEGSGAMWFLLPDEGVAPEELLADKPRCAEILALQAVKLFGLFCLPYLCIRFMGLSPLGFWQVQLLTSLMLFLSNALPNVAGMGSIETAFLLVFGSFLEQGEAMSVLMLYRIASYYVVFAASAVGFFIAQRHLVQMEPPKEG